MTQEEKKVMKRAPFELAALSAEKAFLSVVPEKIWLREIGFALQILRQSADSFKTCREDSIKDAVVKVALTGATLNPALAQAFLVPRTIKGKGLCCILDFSYRGLANIAIKSGSVFDIDASVVYEKDEFYMEQGLEPVLKHVPTLEPDRGKIIGVYAKAILHHNIKKFIWLPKSEVDQAREAGTAKNSPMWRDWYGEGARKTAVKKLYKLLPQTDEMGTAVALANEAEGIDFEKRSHEQGQNILDRFNKEEPKSIEPGAEEPELSTQEEPGDDIPSTETLEFESRIRAAKDVEILLTIFAEFELTKPPKKDLETMAQIRDDRVMELKKK